MVHQRLLVAVLSAGRRGKLQSPSSRVHCLRDVMIFPSLLRCHFFRGCLFFSFCFLFNVFCCQQRKCMGVSLGGGPTCQWCLYSNQLVIICLIICTSLSTTRTCDNHFKWNTNVRNSCVFVSTSVELRHKWQSGIL